MHLLLPENLLLKHPFLNFLMANSNVTYEKSRQHIKKHPVKVRQV